MTTTPTRDELPELLPCPMCEKNARVFKEGYNIDHKPLFHVACKRNRCKMRTPNQLSKRKAIMIWNARSPSPTSELVAALERMEKAATAVVLAENGTAAKLAIRVLNSEITLSRAALAAHGGKE